MSGAHSRRKGAAFGRALVHRFREAMPDAEVRRGLQFRTGEKAPDVELPCFWLEAKHHHRTNVRAALRQAIDASPPGRWPIAVCKDDNAEPLVAMQLEDFLELLGDDRVADAVTAPLDETATPVLSTSEGGHTGAGVEADFREESVAAVDSAGSPGDYVLRDDLHE